MLGTYLRLVRRLMDTYKKPAQQIGPGTDKGQGHGDMNTKHNMDFICKNSFNLF